MIAHRAGPSNGVVQNPGEWRALLYYLSLGVGVVIPPWNFPLAILAGMASAAIVAGNPRCSSGRARAGDIRAVRRRVHEAGVPAGVLNFVTGAGGDRRPSGEGPGRARDRLHRFEGVGLGIRARAAKASPGQKWIKRVVAEMGGKDSVVVAADPISTASAKGAVAAAFGFQGQKCFGPARA